MESKQPLNRKAVYAVVIIAIIVLASTAYIFAQTVQTLQLSLNIKEQGVNPKIEIHLLAQQYRDGKLISESYHAMTLTTAGKDWIADNLFNSGGTNVTQFAMYIGNSNSSDSFNAAWTSIPSEITANGLGRALATWTDTGTGTGNLTKSFSVTGTDATKLYGLYSDTYANAPLSTLVAAEQQGTGSQKNLVNGDTLAITIQVTAS